jgi:hypothetical protein
LIPALLIAAAATAATPDFVICADRPAKANGVCTVPTAHWQLEASAIDWSRTTDGGGSRTDATSIGASTVKLGLSDRSDIEVGWTPYVLVRSRDAASSVSGVGDVVVRYKHRLAPADGPVQLGLLPFVKLPTADRAIGNGQVEGGLAVPISFALAPAVSLTLGPELDLLSDADRHGYHPGIANVVNLGISAGPRLTLTAELWNSLNFEPAGTVRQWSADAAIAYAAGKRVQLDGGANFGLNRATPDVELYAGVSLLF